MPKPLITPDDFHRLIAEEAPYGAWLGLKAETIGAGTATLRLPYRPEHLRPGGVINGPAIMAVADYCMYALALSIDPRGHGAVTTSMTLNFLRKTTGRDLIAEGRVIKSGRTLAVMETTVYAEGEEAPVAHVTGTYAFPRGE
ncbi:MAG TPA: PaaI family thioesterase [Alphaproteobacteria bacterium]